MIRLIKDSQLDNAMINLIKSMVEINEYLTSVLEYTNEVLTVKEEKEILKILNKYKIPQDSLKYDVNILLNNPYFKNINLKEVKTSTVWYENSIIKKRTLMNMDFHKPLGKYLFHYHPIGYFNTDITLPVLKEENKVWMSPAVSEITSMDDGVKKGHGNCLTLGLGLGVLPYLWLLKEEVESVTIVEFNRDVINLFEKYIKPQFNTNKTINIIHGNAIDYFNEDFLSKFDYVYADFWESTEDGLKFYTQLMETEVDLPHIDYWIEDSILYNVKSILVPYLLTLYDGRSISDFILSLDPEERDLAKKINKYFKRRDDIISTEEELLSLIHSKDILRQILAQK